MVISEVVGQGVISAALLGLKFIAVYILIMWAALVFWAVRDMRHRTTDIWLQAAAGTLVLLFFLPGYWLYLVVRPRYTLKDRLEERYRDAIFAEYARVGDCPACHRSMREDYVICPYCEYTLRKSCSACSHALLASWTACPYCGRRAGNVSVEEPLPQTSLPQPSQQPVRV